MKKLIGLAILVTAILSSGAAAQEKSKTFFQKAAGNWEGTLEYLDYSENKRAKLKTYLTITPSADGKSAEFQTIYDDISHIVKSNQTVRIDLTAGKYAAGDSEYKIDSVTGGRIVLLGSGQDGEKVEPIRETITFDEDSLIILKETRTPWQFRNQETFKRTAESALAKRTLQPAQMKEDFSILKNALTAIHPGIYRYQTPESLQKAAAELESQLDKPLPETEFFKIIARFTNKIDCQHTYINPYNLDSIVRERIFNGKNYLPFYFQIIDDKIIVTENASAHDLAKGSEITKINDVPVKKIIEALLTVTKGDGRKTPANRLQSIELTRFEAERFTLFDMYFPLFFPLKNGSFTIDAIDFATKKPVRFQTPALTQEERTTEMAKRYGKTPTYDDGWKFEVRDNSTAYLKIDNSITWRLKTIKFKEFLADAFAEIRAKDLKNLIIDLRGNGGGDMDIGFELSKYLANRELPVYATSKRLVRTVSAHSELAKYLSTYSSELKANLQNGLPANSYKKADNNFYELLPNENLESFPKISPYENNFRGNAYIIADASNASATFQFLTYVQENKLAKIVGQTSGGNKQGINGGNFFFLNLPNSKAEVDIPVYYQAPLAAQKDEGIIPDIPVKRRPEDIGGNYDREISTIEKLIKKKD